MSRNRAYNVLGWAGVGFALLGVLPIVLGAPPAVIWPPLAIGNGLLLAAFWVRLWA